MNEYDYRGIENVASFLYPVILLVALMTGFLRFHQYPLWEPEALLALCCAAIVGVFFGGLGLVFDNKLSRFFIFTWVLLFAIDLQSGGDSGRALLSLFEMPLLKEHKSLQIAAAFFVFFVVFYMLGLLGSALQQHVGKIFLVSSVVFLFNILVLPSNSIEFDTNKVVDQPPQVRHDKSGKTLHLVLDGHIGVEGIPLGIAGGVELKNRLIEFYKKWGFELFGKVYSPYFYTLDSLPAMFNGVAISSSKGLVRESEDPRFKAHLVENRYFKDVVSRGVAIKIIQPDYIDFCSSSEVVVKRCTTYPIRSVYALRNSNLTAVQKAILMSLKYFQQSILVSAAQNLYGLWYSSRQLEILPPGQQIYDSISSPEVFKTIEDEVRFSASGTLVFAHLMLPHSPYIWDSNCEMRRSLKKWLNRKPLHESASTSSAVYREHAYRDYFEQMHCTIDLLDQMFKSLESDGVLEEISIIVHGDHGSRITLTDPVVEYMTKLETSDYVDSFSTHFAVKERTTRPNYNTEQRTTLDLFATRMLGNDNAPEVELELRYNSIKNYGKRMQAVPMVDF